MFEIKEAIRVKITTQQSLTGIRKGDGEPERRLRLGVSMKTGNETLSELSPTLLRAYFKQGDADQDDLIDKNRLTKLVNGSNIDHIPWKGTIEGAQVSFQFGASSSVDFDSAFVSGGKIKLIEGGTCEYVFYIEGPQVGKNVGNAHDFLQGSEADMTIIKPASAEDTQAELDV